MLQAAAIAAAATLTLPADVTSLAAMNRTPMVAAGLSDGQVVVWNGRETTPTLMVKAHGVRVLAVGSNADGTELWSVAGDGSLEEPGEEPRPLGGWDYGGHRSILADLVPLHHPLKTGIRRDVPEIRDGGAVEPCKSLDAVAEGLGQEGDRSGRVSAERGDAGAEDGGATAVVRGGLSEATLGIAMTEPRGDEGGAAAVLAMHGRVSH